MNRRRKKKGAEKRNKKRQVAALQLQARPGETIMPNWAQDCSVGCTCTPHVFLSVDCISIARGVGYDRCLGCEARWTPKSHRWAPATAIARAA